MLVSKIDYVLMTAWKDSKTEESNLKNMNALRTALEASSMHYVNVFGSYKGKFEPSVQVFIGGSWALQQLYFLQEIFNQESILIVYKDKRAFLRYEAGRPEYIGHIYELQNTTYLNENEDFTRLPSGKVLTIR